MKLALIAALMTGLGVAPLMAQEATPGVDMSDPYWTSVEFVQGYCQHRNAIYKNAMARGIEVNPSDATFETWIVEDFIGIFTGIGMRVIGEQPTLTPDMCL